jgi:hypothetical protein
LFVCLVVGRGRGLCILIILVKHCVALLGRKLDFYIILFLQSVERVEGEEEEELRADLCVFSLFNYFL